MRTTVPNGNLWLTEATEIDVNDCDILNDGNLFFVWLIGYVVIPPEKNGGLKVLYIVMPVLEKNHCFTCLLSSEGCDSFHRDLDSRFVPQKGGVKKQ